MPDLHPNGFVVRLLATLPWGMRLRLHTWPEGAERKENPHDHRAWFVSLPLRGTFIEKRFEEDSCESTTRYQVLRCGKTSGNGKPEHHPEGTASLRFLCATFRRRLIPYFCSSSAIHSFAPIGDERATTLVFFGPSKRIPRAFVEPPQKVRCESCKKLDHETNHPTGMVFVGWGIGWKTCSNCGGSGLVEP